MFIEDLLDKALDKDHLWLFEKLGFSFASILFIFKISNQLYLPNVKIL